MSKPPSVGLWAGSSDRGPVASGVSGGIRFVLWRNDKKGNDRAPDYRLVMEAPEKRDTKDDYENKRATGPQDDGRRPDDLDEIPF